MILRDDDSNTIGPATQDGLLHEKLFEVKEENGNIAKTAGGMFIKQADSDYFKFPLTVRCTRDNLATIRTIALNKEPRKFYTPRRVLDGESTIREVEIIFEEIPNIGEARKFSNNIIEITMLMAEVI